MASRRSADELISSGAVLVNGDRPTPSGVLIDPDRDRVTVDGRRVRPVTKHRYIMLNKPLGVITTVSDDSQRTTVLDVVGDEGRSGHRLYPVGRLDVDTTGLLLLTDDGDLAYRLTHPRYKVPKEYYALVAGMPRSNDLEMLRTGVKLADGVTAAAEADLVVAHAKTEVRIVIREGRQRQVRRMLEAVGHPVHALRRTGFGPLKLGRLKTGGWRLLSEAELAALRRAVNSSSNPSPPSPATASRGPQRSGRAIASMEQ